MSTAWERIRRDEETRQDIVDEAAYLARAAKQPKARSHNIDVFEIRERTVAEDPWSEQTGPILGYGVVCTGCRWSVDKVFENEELARKVRCRFDRRRNG